MNLGLNSAHQRLYCKLIKKKEGSAKRNRGKGSRDPQKTKTA